MTTPSRGQLLLQLDTIHANGLLAALKVGTDAHGIPLAFAIAISSRETNCKNILGDKRADGYHGVGLMQADIQHDVARQARDDGSWETPAGTARLIDFCCAMLASNIENTNNYFSDLQGDEVYRIAAAGYNEGMGRAEELGVDGGDSDRGTTGHDYGSDVAARMLIFKDLLTVTP